VKSDELVGNEQYSQSTTHNSQLMLRLRSAQATLTTHTDS